MSEINQNKELEHQIHSQNKTLTTVLVISIVATIFGQYMLINYIRSAHNDIVYMLGLWPYIFASVPFIVYAVLAALPKIRIMAPPPEIKSREKICHNCGCVIRDEGCFCPTCGSEQAK